MVDLPAPFDPLITMICGTGGELFSMRLLYHYSHFLLLEFLHEQKPHARFPNPERLAASSSPLPARNGSLFNGIPAALLVAFCLPSPNE